MKQGVISILITIAGFFLVYRYNILFYEMHSKLISNQETPFFQPSDLISFDHLFKIVTISIGLLSLYLGIITFLKKNQIGLVGSTLSILLFISAYIPFWKYFIDHHQ